MSRTPTPTIEFSCPVDHPGSPPLAAGLRTSPPHGVRAQKGAGAGCEGLKTCRQGQLEPDRVPPEPVNRPCR
eukprot:749292-Hanusia_phi.AAC.1